MICVVWTTAMWKAETFMARQWRTVDGEAIADTLGMLLGFVVSNLN